MKDLISIIIPVYNVEKYLRKCINSVIEQTYKNIEIIIVDDGSTDSSPQICDKLRKIDSRIRVYHKKNEGLSIARNYGIKKSKGKYLIFIDSDDIVSRKLVEKLYSVLINNNADIAIVDAIHFYNNDDNNVSFLVNKKTIIFESEEAICEMLYQKSFLVSAFGKIYKRIIFDDILFPPNLLFEDSAIMYILFEKCKNIAYNKSTLYGYRHRNNSITTMPFSKKTLDILKISKIILDHYYLKPKVRKAALAYYVNANMRIFLNIPNDSFENEKKECLNIIKKNCTSCLLNPKVRKKLKISLILFIINKEFLKIIYNKIDRWSL